MSSDFSIRPASSPVAASVPPPSAAAEDAVATQLPAHQSVATVDSAAHIRNDPQRAPGNTSKQVILDQDAGAVVCQVVDNRTSLVLKQFPDQGFLRRRAYARALQRARDDAIALKVDRKV